MPRGGDSSRRENREGRGKPRRVGGFVKGASEMGPTPSGWGLSNIGARSRLEGERFEGLNNVHATVRNGISL